MISGISAKVIYRENWRRITLIYVAPESPVVLKILWFGFPNTYRQCFFQENSMFVMTNEHLTVLF